MKFFIEKARQRQVVRSNQSGSALVVCMLILVVLTTLGLMSMQTATIETKIATNAQRWEEDFNVSEGGSNVEGTHVGYAKGDSYQWYEISDPEAWNDLLVPTENDDFDPGDDSEAADPSGKFEGLDPDKQKVLHELWPRQNLNGDEDDDELDFTYLVTYLGASPQMIKGFNASKFSAYQFRINGAKRIVVEIGGLKIGVKSL